MDRMTGTLVRTLAIALAVGSTASGCSLLDEDPSRATLGELLLGTYDREQVTGVDLVSLGFDQDDAPSFCDAAGSTPIRWTADAVVPMQIWVDTFTSVTDTPDAARSSVAHLVDFAERRLRWSLSGNEIRPDWDPVTASAAETVIEVAIAECPGLPLVIGPPGRSDRPSGWAGMSDTEVREHCVRMKARLEAGLAEFEEDVGRPPRHETEMDLPGAYYGANDFFGLEAESGGRPRVVAVPGGACDL